jgi:hypothetical protein
MQLEARVKYDFRQLCLQKKNIHGFYPIIGIDRNYNSIQKEPSNSAAIVGKRICIFISKTYINKFFR